MGFRELFDSLHFSCDLGVVKPDLAYYGGIEAALGRGGSDLLFIDDNVQNVEAARTKGCVRCHFHNNLSDGPSMVVVLMQF